MKYQHVDPEEAVRIHIDVQTKKSMAIHWGTFALANEVSLIAIKITVCLTNDRIQASLFPSFQTQDSGIRYCILITVTA